MLSTCSSMSPPPLELARRLARKRNAMHEPAVAVIVVHRVVLRAAVIPDGERAGLPGEAAGELRPDLVLEEKLQQRRALLLGHAAKAHGMGEIDVERFAAGLRMRAHHRMLGRELFADVVASVGLEPVLARARDIRLR